MPGEPADDADDRHHQREIPRGRFGVYRSGSQREFLHPGGRFGSHSINENQIPAYAKRLVFLTYFNAGVRAVDIRDPFNLKEVGHYIPAVTSKTTEPLRRPGSRAKVQDFDPD